jgi:hypothetical protein
MLGMGSMLLLIWFIIGTEGEIGAELDSPPAQSGRQALPADSRSVKNPIVKEPIIGTVVKESDRNEDGKTDFWTYCENGQVIRCEGDRDADGNIDVWIYFEDGQQKTAEVDRDNDGIVDYWRTMDAEGRLEKEEADQNRDGKVDVWAFYKEGQKVKQELDKNYDGMVDLRVYYQGGNMVGREIDTDFDGEMDDVIGHRDEIIEKTIVE